MKFGMKKVATKLVGCSLALSMLLCGAQKSRAIDWGVNLAGAEFAEDTEPGTYGQQYQYPNDNPGAGGNTELDYYNSKGLKLIRLPFRWERMQRSLYGNLDPDELNHFLEFIRQANYRGMKVIPDCHNYARYYVNGGGTRLVITWDFDKSALGDLWKKLIPAVQNAGLMDAIYGWDIMNEPRNLGFDQPGYERDSEGEDGKLRWRDTAQDCIYQIRNVDSTKPILICGYQFSSVRPWRQYNDSLKGLYDPNYNLLFEAHAYWDADTSGRYNNGTNYDFWSQTSGNYNRGTESIADYLKWLRENGLRGFLGEFSVPQSSDWQELMARFLTELRDKDGDVIAGATYWAGSPYLFSDTGDGAGIEPRHGYGDTNIYNWQDVPQMTTYLDVINYRRTSVDPGSGGGGSASSDSISNVNGPSPVSPSQYITVPVNYSATTTRRLEVSLKNPYNNYQWLGGATVDIAPGSGTAYVGFNIDGNAPLGNGFIFTARLNDTDGNLIQEVVQNNVSIQQCLKATYFNNTNFTGSQYNRLDKTVNFNWGTGSPAPGITGDTYSVRWTGFVKPQYSQTYTFRTQADNGVRLWVNNVKLIDKWFNQGLTTYSGSISLQAGIKYSIRLEYYHTTGNASMQLLWSSASVTNQIIPDAATFPYGTIPAPPYYNGITSGAVYRLRNLWTSKYLHATNNTDGSNVDVYGLNNSWGSEKWVIEQVSANIYRLRNVWQGTNGKYLRATNNTDNANVDAFTKNTSWGSEQWYLEKVSGNTFRLRNYWTGSDGKYLNAVSNTNGGNVAVYTKNSSWSSEQWGLELTN